MCFLVGNSPASEFYVLTIRNILFHSLAGRYVESVGDWESWCVYIFFILLSCKKPVYFKKSTFCTKNTLEYSLIKIN